MVPVRPGITFSSLFATLWDDRESSRLEDWYKFQAKREDTRSDDKN